MQFLRDTVQRLLAVTVPCVWYQMTAGRAAGVCHDTA